MNPEGETNYVAELRFAGSVPPPAKDLKSRPLYTDREEAFKALAARVRKLPELLKQFEIIVGKQSFTDAELAAQAVTEIMPMADDLAKT
jgi:hypothetical protein